MVPVVAARLGHRSIEARLLSGGTASIYRTAQDLPAVGAALGTYPSRHGTYSIRQRAPGSNGGPRWG